VYDDYVDGRDSIGSAKIDLKKHVFGKGHYDEWVKLSAMLCFRSNGELHVIIEHNVSNVSFFPSFSNLFCILAMKHDYQINFINSLF
jgi:hypothetical protein